MKRKGILIVVSGFSGSGKGTLMKRLLSQYPDTYALSISATTRAPRKGEEHGREYFFISKDEFEKILSGEVHQSKAITHMVNYCSMMRRDVQFVAKITDKDHKSGCIPDNDGCHSLGLESDNEQLEPCITELETELAACREQSPNTKTSAATKARQEKNLAEWKNAFKAMIPVILQCQEEGPKPRTTPELATMCAKNGVTLDKTKMAFLRECLRECLGTEYVNTTGGPTIQG